MNKTFSLDFITLADCNTEAGFQTIQKAFNYAQEVHKDQKRKSGEPLFLHIYEVAKKIWEKYRDEELTAAAFLHDTLEDDSMLKRPEIYQQFGQTIGFIVDAVSKRYKDFYERDETFDDKATRILWAGQQDIRILLLKMAEREHNLSNIKSLKKDQEIKISFETQAIYETLKSVLSYDHPIPFHESAERLTAFMAENQLSSPLELTKYVLDEIFTSIGNESCHIMYENIDSVIWRVDEMETYESLAYSKVFEYRVDFVLLRATSGGAVEAYFKFKSNALEAYEKAAANAASK